MNAPAGNTNVLVHERGLCESATVGRGTRVWAFAHVCAGATIGNDCNIGDHAYIEGGARIGDGVIIKNQVMVWDGVTIEDCVFVGPGTIFTNDRYPRSRHLSEAAGRYRQVAEWLVPTVIRRGATIGAGAVIVCGVTIGEYATVAAGSVVTHDVAPQRLVAGAPARNVGFVCRCGVVLDGSARCVRCDATFPDLRDAGALSRNAPAERVVEAGQSAR